MLFYFSFALICFCSLWLDFSNTDSIVLNKTVKTFENIYFVLFAVALVCFGGFRWLTGSDWNAYYNFFTRYTTWEEFKIERFELGYTFLNYVVKQISNDYTSFLLVFHALVILPKVKIIKTISAYPMFSLLLYCCTYMGEIVAIRNSLAVSFLLLSIPYIHNKNKAMFVFYTLLATSIHYSAFAWIVSYHIYHKDISSKKWISYFIFSVIFMLSAHLFVGRILSIILKPFGSAGVIFEKILIYSSEDHTDSARGIVHILLSLLKRLIFIPLYFLCYDKLCGKSKYNKGLLNLYFMGNCMNIMFMTFFSQLVRCVLANIFLEVFLLPPLILANKKKYISMLLFFVFLLYGFLKLWLAVSSFPDILIPYYSIFNFQNRAMH